MKYRKNFRFYSALLAMTLVLLSLAGCGGTSPGAEGATKGQPVEPEPDAVETEAETAAFRPVIGLTFNSDFHYDETLGMNVNRMETELAGVDAATREACPELADALDRVRADALATEREAFQEREAMLSEILAEENAVSLELYGEMRSLIRRADAQAVSFVNAWSEYAGGIHESYGYAVHNFDTSTGAEITLESLLTDEGAASLNSRLGAELDALYPDIAASPEIAPSAMIADYAADDYAFSIEPDGVTFWFNPYQIASYADGLLTAKLYFDRDADILNDAYKGTSEAWFVELGDEIPYRFAANGGTFRNVEFWEILSPDNPGWRDGFAMEFDAPGGANRWIDRPTLINWEEEWTSPEGRLITLDDTGFFDARAYYAHIPDGDYVVVTLTLENDYHGMVAYGADGALANKLELMRPAVFYYPEPPENPGDWSLYDAYHISLTDPNEMPSLVRENIFGTWEADGLYRLTREGLQLIGNLLYASQPYELTLNQNLTVTRMAADNWLLSTEEEYELPEGTAVELVGASGDMAFFRVPEPPQGFTQNADFIFALSCDTGSWPHTVNGMDGMKEWEIFDGLHYAG